MDPAERAVMRSYTIREQRHEPREFDVDFALHGDGQRRPRRGGRGRWAATPGPATG